MTVGGRVWSLLIAVIALGAVYPRAASAAGVCDASCDADCQTCCKVWSLRAVCADGEHLGETGSFPSPADAATSASSTAAPTATCADKTAPKWTPYCAPENGVASPLDTPTMASLVALRASVGQSLRGVRDTQSALEDFAEKRLVNKAGVTRIATSASALRTARKALVESMSAINQIRTRGSPTDAEVASLDQASKDPRQTGDQAAKDAQATMADPTIIDTAAEERQQKIAAALAAAKAAQEAAAERAAEARQKAEEAAAAAKAAAAAGLQGRADATRTQLLTSLDATEKKRADLAATLATFQARSDVFPQARSVGDVLTKRLADLQQRIAAERTKVDGTSSLAPDAALATLGPAGGASNALAGEVGRTGNDVKALTTSPWNVQKPTVTPPPPSEAAPAAAPAPAVAPAPTPAPAPAPAPPPVVAPVPVPAPAPAPPPTVAVLPPPGPAPVGPPTLVPTCEIAFDTHTVGITLAIDRGKSVPLPARIRVSSGQHTLSIQMGSAKSQKRELLLCGHLDTFPVEGP